MITMTLELIADALRYAMLLPSAWRSCERSETPHGAQQLIAHHIMRASMRVQKVTAPENTMLY